MAYGFGSTFGTSGTTDRIDLGAMESPAIFTLCLWTYRNGPGGGGNNGRLLGAGRIEWMNDEGAGTYQYNRVFATTAGVWTVPQPSAGAWHPTVVRHNGTSDPLNPLIDFETPQAVTTVTAPVGAPTTTGGVNRLIGNRPGFGFDRAWDGLLAEYAIWHRILTDGEVAGLVKGITPAAYPGLVHYRPLIRGIQDRVVTLAGTVSGALVQPHTIPMRYRRSGVVQVIPQPPPAGPPVVEAIGAKAEAGASSAPLVVPLPAGVEANDILLLAVENSAGAAISLSSAQGFAQIGSTVGGGDQTGLAVFWKRAVGGDTAPTLAGTGGGNAHYCAGIVRISGVRTTGTPWEDAPVTGSEATINTTLTATGGTTTVDNVMVVVLAAQGTDTDTPQYSNWANASLTEVGEAMDYSSSLGGGGGVAVATGLKAAAGTVSATTATLATGNADAFMTLFLVGVGEVPPEPPAGDLAQRRSHSSLGTRIGSRQVQE